MISGFQKTKLYENPLRIVGGDSRHKIKVVTHTEIELFLITYRIATQANAFNVKSSNVGVGLLVNLPGSTKYPSSFHIRAPILQKEINAIQVFEIIVLVLF